MRLGTQEMLGVLEVKGEATEASSSDREMPPCALFRAWEREERTIVYVQTAVNLCPFQPVMLDQHSFVKLVYIPHNHLLHLHTSPQSSCEQMIKSSHSMLPFFFL